MTAWTLGRCNWSDLRLLRLSGREDVDRPRLGRDKGGSDHVGPRNLRQGQRLLASNWRRLRTSGQGQGVLLCSQEKLDLNSKLRLEIPNYRKRFLINY